MNVSENVSEIVSVTGTETATATGTSWRENGTCATANGTCANAICTGRTPAISALVTNVATSTNVTPHRRQQQQDQHYYHRDLHARTDTATHLVLVPPPPPPPPPPLRPTAAAATPSLSLPVETTTSTPVAQWTTMTAVGPLEGTMPMVAVARPMSQQGQRTSSISNRLTILLIKRLQGTVQLAEVGSNNSHRRPIGTIPMIRLAVGGVRASTRCSRFVFFVSVCVSRCSVIG